MRDWVQDGLLAVTAGLVWRYVWLTAGIKSAALNQSEGASRPVVTIRNAGAKSAVLLENIGTGPALNIHVVGGDVQSEDTVYALAASRSAEVPVSEVPGKNEGGLPSRTFSCEYTSVGKVRYRSTVDFWRGVGNIRIQRIKNPEVPELTG